MKVSVAKMTQIIPGSMKKIISILGVVSLFAACTAELDTTPEITEEQAPITKEAPVLYASIEEGAETKVYLDENYKVLWHADDRISVFNKDTYNLQYRFDGNTGDNSGTFSEVPDGLLHTSNDIENLYAVYPYNASTSISNTSVLTVNFPAAQTYSADSFGRGANTMVAVTDGNNLQFKNACGYLMFKLYGTDVKVKTVSLRGNNNEKIAGEATITMPLGGTPTVAMSGSATEEIVLTCTDAVTIGTSSSDYTEFWFALPPVSFTKGFTLTVTDEDGGYFSKSTYSPVEIVRSYAKKMAPIQVDYESYLVLKPNYTSLPKANRESTLPGFSLGYVVEMKFQMAETTSYRGYPLGSDNLMADDYNYLRLSLDGKIQWTTSDEDEPFFSKDLSSYGISCTDIITLRFSSLENTLSINGVNFDCSLAHMDFNVLFARYDYDEGFTDYTAAPEGTKVFYVKAYNSLYDYIYDGYPTESINPQTGNIEKCWFSNYKGTITYTFANDAANQGPFGGYIK